MIALGFAGFGLGTWLATDITKDWDFWERIDRSFLEWCEEVHVVCLDGWKESRGVNDEIRIAREMNKPVKLIKNIQ